MLHLELGSIVIKAEHGHLSADLMLTQVDPDKVDSFSNDVRPYIEDALRFFPPAWDVDSMLEKAKTKEIQLFAIMDDDKVCGAVTTRIDEYPLAKAFTILQLGSDHPMTELEGMFEELESWAKSNGCDYGSIVGRPGWEKLLPDYNKTNVRFINWYR